MTEQRLIDLLSCVAAWLSPSEGSRTDRVKDLVLCMSLFDGPERTGKLAEVRRQSQAETLEELREYIRLAVPVEELNELAHDSQQRTRALMADLGACRLRHPTEANVA